MAFLVGHPPSPHPAGRQDSLGIGPVPSASPRTSRGIQSVAGGEWGMVLEVHQCSPDPLGVFFWGNPTGNTLIFTGKKGPTGWFLQLLLEKHRERSHSQQYSCSEQHDKVQVVRCWNSNEVDRPQLPLPCHILWSTDIYGQRLCSCNWQCFSMTSWHMLTFYVYQAG